MKYNNTMIRTANGTSYVPCENLSTEKNRLQKAAKVEKMTALVSRNFGAPVIAGTMAAWLTNPYYDSYSIKKGLIVCKPAGTMLTPSDLRKEFNRIAGYGKVNSKALKALFEDLSKALLADHDREILTGETSTSATKKALAALNDYLFPGVKVNARSKDARFILTHAFTAQFGWFADSKQVSGNSVRKLYYKVAQVSYVNGDYNTIMNNDAIAALARVELNEAA